MAFVNVVKQFSSIYKDAFFQHFIMQHIFQQNEKIKYYNTKIHIQNNSFDIYKNNYRKDDTLFTKATNQLKYLRINKLIFRLFLNVNEGPKRRFEQMEICIIFQIDFKSLQCILLCEESKIHNVWFNILLFWVSGDKNVYLQLHKETLEVYTENKNSCWVGSCSIQGRDQNHIFLFARFVYFLF